MTFYLRNGTSYRVTDKANMDLHNKLPAGNYIVKEDQFGNLFLDQIDEFIIPMKIYGDISKNANKILRTYLDRTSSTGVMLTGEKGSGKTLLSKQISIIAAKEGIPTIVINSPWHGDAFNDLIQNIEQPCIVLFDEFEKVYDKDDQEAILTLLDGVFQTRKLFILTCNNKWQVDTHMHNRPGRIYYLIDFKGLESTFIEEYCEDNLKNKTHIDAICKISNLFGEFNFDMLKAIIEEMNRYNETPQDAMRLLNVKPEFGEKVTYTIKLKVNGVDIPIEDLCNETWIGNPVTHNNIKIMYKRYNKKDKTEWDWETVEFSTTDLKNVDATKGEFTFADATSVLILTRFYSKTFDYFNAF
jgi:hypothetical protein